MRHRLAGALSSSQQQMLAMGRALMSRPACHPRQPSMGLAEKLVGSILDVLLKLREDGLSLLLGGAERQADASASPVTASSWRTVRRSCGRQFGSPEP